MSFNIFHTGPGAFNTSVAGTPAVPFLHSDTDEPIEGLKEVLSVGQQLMSLAAQLEDEGFGDVSQMAGMVKLRTQLMVEELGETVVNMAIGNLPMVLDGLADLAYVTGGTVAAFDLGKVFDNYFVEVHQCNMNKANSNNGVRVRDKGENWVPPNPEAILVKAGFMKGGESDEA